MRTGLKLLAGMVLVIVIATTGATALAHSDGQSGEERTSWANYPLFAEAVPGNDSFDAATVISGTSGSTTGTNVDATVGSSPVTGYRIYRGTSSDNEALLDEVGNVTSYDDHIGLLNRTTYWSQVSAMNATGEGMRSNELLATPGSVPGAPSLDLASGTDNAVVLHWSPPADDGGEPIAGYIVYRGTTAGGEAFLDAVGDVHEYTDSTALNGTTYYYIVTAANALGQGPLSNERFATPPAPATAPGAPTLAVPTAGSNNVTLSWSTPVSDGGSTITGYKIYRGTSSGNETPLTTLGNVTSFNDPNLTNGTRYFYKVSAVNSVGESPLSNELSATPATVPGAPVLTAATFGNTTVALSWSAPGSDGGSAITAYKVYRGTSSGTETLWKTLGNVTSFTDAGLTNGTTYFYKVSAVNSVDEGARSNELSATPATVPGAPSLSFAAGGNNLVSLVWSGPSSNGGAAITAYRIFRGTSSGSETLLTTVGNTIAYNDTTAVNGTTYFYVVAAVNAAGEGLKSNEGSATPAAVPSAPTIGPVTVGGGAIAFSWTPPASAGGAPVSGYKLYRSAALGSETLLATLGLATTYIDNTVVNGTLYTYRVSAVNSVGEGLKSADRSAVPTAVGLPAPGWWSGICDADWWNPRAVTAGWAGAGAHELGALYLGVPVCGPRPAADLAPAVVWARWGVAVPEWDAKELAFRFMTLAYGVTPYAASAEDVVRLYTAGAGGALQTVANGTAGAAPRPGDVISFDSPTTSGHVAVVAWSGVDANGNGSVVVLSQNDTVNGWRSLTVTGWTVQAFDGNTPYAWLHDPAGRGVADPPPHPELPGRAQQDPPDVQSRPPVPDFTPPPGAHRPPLVHN